MGDALIVLRLPSLTYMLSFPDLSELNAKWDAFRNDPGWKKLSSSPKYAYESIVSNITNLILSSTSYSQIYRFLVAANWQLGFIRSTYGSDEKGSRRDFKLL